MPTYDYQCEACGHAFELFQSMTDAVKRKCPKCAQLKLKRLVGTGAGIIFKGSGFYETDYRSESYTKAAEAEKKSGTETKSETKDSATSETKSAETKSASSDSKPARKPGPKKKGKT